MAGLGLFGVPPIGIRFRASELHRLIRHCGSQLSMGVNGGVVRASAHQVACSIFPGHSGFDGAMRLLGAPAVMAWIQRERLAPRSIWGMPPEAASVLYEATRITLMSLDIVSLNAKTIIEPMNLGVAWGETLMEASGLEICQGRRRALEDKAVEGALSALMMTDEPHEVLHDLDQIANQNLPEILLRKRGILEHLNSYRATHRMPPFVQSYEEALRQVSQRHLAWTAVEQAGYLLRLVRAHLEGLNTIQKCDETHGASFIMDSMVAFMVTMTLGQARSWALQLDLSQRNQ